MDTFRLTFDIIDIYILTLYNKKSSIFSINYEEIFNNINLFYIKKN